jgi:PAS domain S-box-containing protein
MSEKPRTVLIIDDTPEDRETYRRLLESAETAFTVLEAERGDAGLALCRERQPDCLLLDYRLPDMDGLEIITELVQEAGKNAYAIIMLTGTGNAGIAIQAMKAGAHDYLHKGTFSAEQLQRTINHAVEKVVIQKQLEEQRHQLEERNYELKANLAALQREVGERSRVEAALKENQRFIQEIMATTPAVLYLFDLTTRRTDFVSPYVSSTLGYTPDEIAAMGARILSRLIHRGDRRRTKRHFRNLVRVPTDEIAELEYRIRHKNGTWRWFASRDKVFVREEDGTPQSVFGLAIDITERRQTQEKLAFQADILAKINDAVLITEAQPIDLPGPRIVYVNEAFTRMTGYRAEEIIGKTPRILQGPETGRSELDKVRAALREWRSERVEVTNYHKDGSSFEVEFDITPIADATGWYTYWISIQRDVTERKRLLTREQSAREEAEAANRAKDEFLAIISHELRSPLNAITGWVHLLAHKRPLSEETLAKAVEVIQRSALQQKQLIEDLLDTARVISGKLKLEVQPVDPLSLIEAALDAVRPAADAKCIRLYTQIDPRADQITGDPHRLQQIIWNLLSNAVKFTPAGGRVELSVAREDPWINLCVSDTGKGIAPEFLPYVFDRFRQADSSSTRRYGGLGLGLALVRHLTELHGGSVHVISGGEGQGATFCVQLPLRAVRTPVSPRSPGDGSAAEATLLAGLRCLVVDDSADARDLLTAVLTTHGAAVHAAASGAEALDYLGKHPVDVLVCDIGMPGEDGYTVLRQLRSSEAERGIDLPARLPAIALTAYAQPEDHLKALMAGFQSHLAKPVDPADLTIAIARLMGRREAMIAADRPDRPRPHNPSE